jgi:hypothetical protein
MSIKHRALLIGIIVLFISVVAYTYLYGPRQRSFNAQGPQVLTAESTEQIARILDSAAVKGRIAICFTRYLNALEAKESKGLTVTESSMEKGIFRRVYHITPDSAWPEISATLSNRNGIRLIPEGFIGIFDYGRVYIMPLSRFSPVREKALIIVEPKVWTNDELKQIAAGLKSGNISSDLVVIIRGAEKDAELFRQALSP